MIMLTKLNGQSFTLNALYIEEIQSLPDTIITLTSGKKMVVKEKEDEITAKAVSFYQKIAPLAIQPQERA